MSKLTMDSWTYELEMNPFRQRVQFPGTPFRITAVREDTFKAIIQYGSTSIFGKSPSPHGRQPWPTNSLNQRFGEIDRLKSGFKFKVFKFCIM
jgi:hypothetical protein